MTSIFRQLLVPAVILCMSAQLASAQDAAAPLFPEVIIPTDDSMSDDPELAVFRATLAEAARAHVRSEQGQLHDPSQVLKLMSDEVEFFVAQGPDANFSDLDFVSLGAFAPQKALEMLGRLDSEEPTPDALVQQRYAMWAVEEMLGDPTVGKSPWLDDRICTASYGRLTWVEWLPLWQALRYEIGEWVIAAAGEFGGISQLKRFQMVAVSPEQKRSAGWLGIIAPIGGGEFFRQDEAYFAPYLNNHLCFGKVDGQWKVTAIAYRLD